MSIETSKKLLIRFWRLQIDLGQPTAVTGILTQGVRRYLKNQYVTAFKIAYSKEGQLWRYYKEGRFTKVSIHLI